MIALVGVTAVAGCFTWAVRLRDITVSTSPDGRYRVAVRERLRHLDRNFDIFVADSQTGIESLVFRSEDQSPANSQERIIWSNDSQSFALLGDRYYVVDGSTFPGGEVLFFAMDVSSRKVWCNTDHVGRGFKTLSVDELPDELGIRVE